MKLRAKNALAFTARLRFPGDDGKPAPLESGSVAAFLATSDDPDAVAVSGLTVDATYTGSGGRWLVQFPAAMLDDGVLDAAFGEMSPWCILTSPAGLRAAIPLEYERSFVVSAT